MEIMTPFVASRRIGLLIEFCEEAFFESASLELSKSPARTKTSQKRVPLPAPLLPSDGLCVWGSQTRVN